MLFYLSIFELYQIHHNYLEKWLHEATLMMITMDKNLLRRETLHIGYTHYFALINGGMRNLNVKSLSMLWTKGLPLDREL